MNAGFGSWLLGMSLDASAIGGMLGTFIVLAATTFSSALLYAISGFGFAVLLGALVPLASMPMAAVLLVAIFPCICPTGSVRLNFRL